MMNSLLNNIAGSGIKYSLRVEKINLVTAATYVLMFLWMRIKFKLFACLNCEVTLTDRALSCYNEAERSWRAELKMSAKLSWDFSVATRWNSFALAE